MTTSRFGAQPLRLLSLLLAVALATTAGATTYVWSGDTSVDDDWATAGNWSPAGPPATGLNGFTINAGSSSPQPVVYNEGVAVDLGATGSAVLLGNAVSDAGYLLITGTDSEIDILGQTTTIGNSGVGVITIANGGALTKEAGNFYVGGLAGGSGTVNILAGGTLTFQNLNTNPDIGRAGDARINVHGGTFVLGPVSSGRNVNIGVNTAGTGTGVLDLRGGTVDVTEDASTYALNVGYAATSSDRGRLQGYGSIDMRNDGGIGLIQLGGQIVADGTHTDTTVADETLHLAYGSGSGDMTTADNTPGTTHYGLYTANRGALDIMPVGTGATNTFWGDDQANTTLWTPGNASDVIVNSVYVNHAGTSATTLDISLLDPTRSTTVGEASGLLANGTGYAFLNIWQVTPDGGDLDVLKFNVRYDEGFSPINAADQYGDLVGFFYWDGTSGSWADLTADTQLDLTNYLAAYTVDGTLTIGDGESGFFALAAVIPEPATVSLIALGAATLLRRRQR